MRDKLFGLLIFLLLIVPQSASADIIAPYTLELTILSGIPFLFPVIIVVAEALVAFVLVRMVFGKGITIQRALLASFVANLVSSVLGLFTPFSLASILNSLIFTLIFLFTVFVEYWFFSLILRKIKLSLKNKLFLVVSVNVVSYLIVFLFILSTGFFNHTEPIRGPSPENYCLMMAQPLCEAVGILPPHWNTSEYRIGNEILTCEEITRRSGRECSCINYTLTC